MEERKYAGESKNPVRIGNNIYVIMLPEKSLGSNIEERKCIILTS